WQRRQRRRGTRDGLRHGYVRWLRRWPQQTGMAGVATKRCALDWMGGGCRRCRQAATLRRMPVFLRPRALARGPQAKSWERRAALSLSRLEPRQGRRDNAQPLLERSTAGSRRGLIPTCRTPRRCVRRWPDLGPHRWPPRELVTWDGPQHP